MSVLLFQNEPINPLKLSNHIAKSQSLSLKHKLFFHLRAGIPFKDPVVHRLKMSLLVENSINFAAQPNKHYALGFKTEMGISSNTTIDYLSKILFLKCKAHTHKAMVMRWLLDHMG